MFSCMQLIGMFLLLFTTALPSAAQTLTTLVNFDNETNGQNPYSSPVQGGNGHFYGATGYGGPYADSGTLYEMAADGSLTTLLYFNQTNGALPFANFLLTANGNFYSTTFYGGLYGGGGAGVIFELTPAGEYTVVYSFCPPSGCPDGGNPNDALIQATNGNFYGTTASEGANGQGTVFEFTAGGTLTALYSFCSKPNCTDGANPYAGLVQAANGKFYGTTNGGGTRDRGTVFEITAAGKIATLYSFCSLPGCTDGWGVLAGLVQATNGNLYGTAFLGGAHNHGTIFEITPAGKFTTLYSFCARPNCTDGARPMAALIQATDGNLYGTTMAGTSDNGTIFRITTTGTLTTLYSFCSKPNCADGAQPLAALTQATNGNFYGTTSGGGSSGNGTVFELSLGLAPFAETVPAFGKVGAKILILGNNLSGTTNVSFNGTDATFTVVSETEITATVPAGATTGTVKVTTPSGALTSNVVFQVLP